jgi:hypothetical protein
MLSDFVTPRALHRLEYYDYVLPRSSATMIHSHPASSRRSPASSPPSPADKRNATSFASAVSYCASFSRSTSCGPASTVTCRWTSLNQAGGAALRTARLFVAG